MLFKRRTARKRNLLGRPIRGVLPVHYAESLSRDELLNHLDAGWALPMAGGTSAQNQTLANAVYWPKAIVVSTDQTIHQGDLVWWDGVNYTLKPLTLATQVADVLGVGGFCGVANGSNVPSVYPDSPSLSENLPGVTVQRGGTVTLLATSGDGTYFPFEPVTVGATSQTITRGGQTSANRVGFVIVPAPVTPRGTPGATPAPETITATATARVEVLLESKFLGTVIL